MSFTFRPAIRQDVSLIIGVSGQSGSGKTFSALRLASGIADGKPFAVIDTENGRARHYADQFNFDVCDISAPFRPDLYADAITAADKAGYPVIVVDSVSHCWSGEGGCLDWQEEELDRMAGQDFKKREACKMSAWVVPKNSHKRMVQKMLQVKAHLILCLRAAPKVEMVREKDENGRMRTMIQAKQTLTSIDGFIPECEKNLPFELTASFLMTADKPGFPKPIKLQEQHRALFPLDKPINEESGRLVALWASGGSAATKVVDPKIARLGDAIAAAGFDVADILKAWKKKSLDEVMDVEAALTWIEKKATPITTIEIPQNEAVREPVYLPLTQQVLIDRFLLAKDIALLRADHELIEQLPAHEQQTAIDVYMDRLEELGRK